MIMFHLVKDNVLSITFTILINQVKFGLWHIKWTIIYRTFWKMD